MRSSWAKLFATIAVLAIVATPIASPAFLIQKPASGYVGPGDVVAFTAWYGTRGYSAAKAALGTTPMMRLNNQTSGELCDVLVAATGGVGLTTSCTGASNGVAASTFCTVGGCRVQTWYDQTGNNACGGASCDLVQNTAGARLAAGGLSSIATSFIQVTGGSQNETSANNVTPTSPISLSIVASKNSNSSSASRMFSQAGVNNGINASAAANTWILNGGATSFSVAGITNSVYHTGNAVIDGASSVLTINGVDNNGTAAASGAAGAPNSLIGVVGATYAIREAGFINNYALSSGERTSLNAQQRAYWSI